MPRPVTYAREKVVERAALQFWRDGFAASDVDTLTRNTGLNRHSLYGAFGGKAGLFHEALEHYVTRIAAPYLALLEEGAGLDALVAYFESVTGYDRRGCLVTNIVAEMGGSDAQVAACVARYYDRVERAFAGLIARGQAEGSIRADLDPAALAHWLRLTSQGIGIAARMESADAGLPALIRATFAPLSPPSQQG